MSWNSLIPMIALKRLFLAILLPVPVFADWKVALVLDYGQVL